MRVAIIFLLLWVFWGCATREKPLLYETSSGKPEVVLSGVSLGEARERIAGRCRETGKEVEEREVGRVVCGKVLEDDAGDFLENFASHMLLGVSSQGVIFTEKIEFLLIPRGSEVLIVGSRHWMKSDQGLGLVENTDFTDNESKNRVYKFLQGVR